MNALTIFLIILCLILGLSLYAFFREWIKQRNLILQLMTEKSQYDILKSLIQNTVTRGGWIDIVHNGDIYPFGVLLDKVEPKTKIIQ